MDNTNQFIIHSNFLIYFKNKVNNIVELFEKLPKYRTIIIQPSNFFSTYNDFFRVMLQLGFIYDNNPNFDQDDDISLYHGNILNSIVNSVLFIIIANCSAFE